MLGVLSEERLEQRECSEVAMRKRERIQGVKYYHTARPGWDLLRGTTRDTDQNRVGQVTRLSLMLLDVFEVVGGERAGGNARRGRWRGAWSLGEGHKRTRSWEGEGHTGGERRGGVAEK